MVEGTVASPSYERQSHKRHQYADPHTSPVLASSLEPSPHLGTITRPLQLPFDLLVVGLDRGRIFQILLRVLVADPHARLVRQRAQLVVERRVHHFGRPRVEIAAATDKKTGRVHVVEDTDGMSVASFGKR